MMTKRALPLTSHTSLGNSDRSTGFYYDETAAPCWTIRDIDWDVTLASAGEGGLPDPKILVDPDKRPPDVAHFMYDTLAMGEVCHGPSGFLQAKEMNDDPLVHNKPVNSFTNRETEQIELNGVEPVLLEIRLRDAGALIGCCDNFTRHAAEDGQLITGQNLQSTEAVCRSLEESLEES